MMVRVKYFEFIFSCGGELWITFWGLSLLDEIKSRQPLCVSKLFLNLWVPKIPSPGATDTEHQSIFSQSRNAISQTPRGVS